MHFELGQKIIDKIRKKNPTSLSDNEIYPKFCAEASLNSEVFKNFRSNSDYMEILEHLTEEQGNEYIEEIKKNDTSLLTPELVDEYRKNDEWGNPAVYKYENIGIFSPTTLRYIKVLSDLKKYFDLQNHSITEIGVGYGGQCRIITSNIKINQYDLIDLKPVLDLTKKYLDNYPINSVLTYKTMNEIPKQKYDFVMSNYAFTELPRKIQKTYLKKIILNSNSGYITYNEICHKRFHSYTKEELLKILPNNPRIIEEKPLTHPKNCIIVWGSK